MLSHLYEEVKQWVKLKKATTFYHSTNVSSDAYLICFGDDESHRQPSTHNRNCGQTVFCFFGLFRRTLVFIVIVIQKWTF